MRDLSRSAPHRNSSRTRLDAIVIPTIRPVQALRTAIELAASTETQLLVLCSRQSHAALVAEHLAGVPGLRAFVVGVPDEYGLPSLHLATSAPGAFREANAGRTSDLSLKRNLGLALARLLGWNKILFLDDDIYGIDCKAVERLAGQLENAPIAAFRAMRFPDNSVACHANRISGGRQDVFMSGSALGVNCLDLPLPFFPDIYNEDWFAFSRRAEKCALPLVGESRQRTYDPFASPSRAAQEEFGDLLAEGLFALIEEGGSLSEATSPGYWAQFTDERRRFLEDTSCRLDERSDADSYRALQAVTTAWEQLSRITPDMCGGFVHAWQEDCEAWLTWTQRLSPRISPESAFDLLQLREWRATEFANADRPKHLVSSGVRG